MQSESRAAGNARASKRRSSRVKLKIPLTIRATGDNALKAETVSVSKHGAKIRITGASENLSCGERMSVSIRSGKGVKAARVVWLDRTSEPHCGIELDQPDNFWGVYFPSKNGDDWRSSTTSSQPATPAAPAPQLEFAGRAVPPTELCITPRTGEAMVHDDATDTRTLPARVTGLSAIRMPLSESVDIVFTRPDEATAMFRDLVEPGTVVRLLLSKQRVVMGRVAAIGTHRQGGKWRVRIKCDAPCY